MPKSSTYELVYTLMEKGILEFDNKDLRTFRLGIKIFEMGMTVLDKVDFHKIARSFLEELSVKTGERIFMAVEDKGSIIYIDRIETHTTLANTAGIGMRGPMNCSGLGKALLATYSIERVKEVWKMRDNKTNYTNNTIRKYNDLIKDLQLTRERGYAIDNREREDDIFCVAAPIYDLTDKAVCAISISSIYLKMDKERTEMFGKMIRDTALDISKILGYRRNEIY